MVDRGALTPNGWLAIMNLGPVEGGDVPIRRLDTALVDDKPTKLPDVKPVDDPPAEPNKTTEVQPNA
jgi:hypothetical protein